MASSSRGLASPKIVAGSATQVGTRHARNEDYSVVASDLFEACSNAKGTAPHAGAGNKVISVFSIFDGHGGHKAAEWASKNLHCDFADLMWQKNSEAAVPWALQTAFGRCDAELCALSQKMGDTSGSCATMCVVRGDKVYVGNAGDSKAIIFELPTSSSSPMKKTRGASAGPVIRSVDLNPRHGAELKTERTRILRAGGRISRDGAIFGVLCPSRGFGDIDVRAQCADVIIADPEGAGIENQTLCPQPAYELGKGATTMLVVASDGLWDFATDKDVTALVAKGKQSGKNEAEIAKQPVTHIFGSGPGVV